MKQQEKELKHDGDDDEVEGANYDWHSAPRLKCNMTAYVKCTLK